ncbi:MAG: rod shape-determining protein MreD [bacterium]
MIVTWKIVARLCALALLTAILQTSFVSQLWIFGSSPEIALLVVMAVGLLGGSLTGSVFGFSVGLLLDCLLMSDLGALALTLMAVGYFAGRYREAVGRPTRLATVLLGGLFTFAGGGLFAVIQLGLGVDSEVTGGVARDLLVQTLLGFLLVVPILLLVRLWLRSALIEDGPSQEGRRMRRLREKEKRVEEAGA